MDLLQIVSALVKWQDVQSLHLLESHIRAALSDEFIRALREPLDPSRTRKLIRNRAESYSRCKVVLRALGIEDDLASEFANDQSVGNVLKIEDPGLHVVVGPQGSGKTLACHRLFQAAVDRVLSDSSQPHPILISAAELVGPVRETIERQSQGYADAHVQRLLVIVDGIDEKGSREATMILRDLETYAGVNPSAIAVTTIRPLPGIEISPTAIKIPMLDAKQQQQLIERVSGRRMGSHDVRYWPAPIRDSARLPLFAIMIGMWLRTNPKIRNLSVPNLVNSMAQYALRETGNGSAETDDLLKRLAVKTTTCGAPVYPHAVVASFADQHELADSRLVLQSESRIGFSLPIFQEWYAARAILENTVAVDSIDLTSDRWITPMAIVVHSQDRRAARAIMNHIVLKNVNAAAAVLKDYDSASYFDPESPEGQYTGIEAGEQIRQTMQVWQRAMGRLFRVVDLSTEKVSSRLSVSNYLTTKW